MIECLSLMIEDLERKQINNSPSHKIHTPDFKTEKTFQKRVKRNEHN